MPGAKIHDADTLGQVLGTSNSSKDSIKEQVDKFQKLLKDAVKSTADYAHAYEAKLIKKQQHDEKQEKINALKEAASLENNLFKKTALSMKASMADIANNFSEKLTNGLKNSFNKFMGSAGRSIDEYISVYSKYMGTISARIQGSDLTYTGLMSNISRNLATSPYVRQTDMISNLNKFVESGITYNLELRSYIATVSDKIADTFDAFDSSLLRIIRIQQADSTTARLGMEALLTQYLNATFGDTSYLNTSKNISAMLLEAESQMGYKGASEFEFAVQKWLGSMSAVGVSQGTLESIATGLGYLGSGNVGALTGNQGLMNLLTIAASRSGQDIGTLLTGGLTAESANRVMSGLVNFMQEIAQTDNLVVRSEYARLFGMTISDLTSILNLSTEDLMSISEDMFEYSSMITETRNQLEKLSERTSVSDMVSNVLSNLMTNIGSQVATNPALYGIWEVASLMQSSGIDIPIPIPFVGTMSTTNLMKTGVIGASGLMSLISVIGNLTGGNMAGTSLDVWRQSETTTRGKGLSPYTVGATTSQSSYIGPVDTSTFGETFESEQKQAAAYTGTEISSSDELLEVVRDNIAEDVHSMLIKMENFETMLTTSNFGRLLQI